MSRVHPLTILCGLACAAGFLFAAVSTSDFVAHLDRQVHGIHCSFLPGLSATDTSGASGCLTTLMSPYSSVFRSSIWGGIPVALPGMAVFSFLLFWCVWIALQGRDRDPRATGFLFVGSLVPLLTSGVMGYLAMVELDAACKLCIGIYASSLVLSLASLVLWRMAASEVEDVPAPPTTEDGRQSARQIAPLSFTTLGLAFAAGLTCVGISVGAYAAAAPDFSSYIGSCGSLPHGQTASADVIIPFGPQKGKPRVLEVIDPLCPSCKGFEERLSQMPIADSIDRELLLFPLDESCNWMIDRSIHPGACSISEAVLCSTDPAPVIHWAFEHQQEIMAATEKDPKAASKMAKARFPSLAQCIGSAEAGAKVNQSLRWAVKNRLQILTPQVFVEGTRLCGEDTDLGLDYALPRLIAHTKSQPRPKRDMVDDAEDDAKTPPPAPRPAPARPKPSNQDRYNAEENDAAVDEGNENEDAAPEDEPEQPSEPNEPSEPPPPKTPPATSARSDKTPAAPAAKTEAATKQTPEPAAAPAAAEEASK